MLTFIVFVLTATLIVVQLASGQSSPRVIAMVLATPWVKIALGLLTFTYTYSIAALGRVEDRVPDLLVGTAVLTVAFASQVGKQRFGEIDVGRINIVESDGKLRMVISNGELQHPGQVDGKLMPRPDGRAPGLLFFDHRGDECGGLVFDENGGKGHFVSLTMDKGRQDQTIGIQHLESDNGQYFAGLTIWDRPDSSLVDLVEEMKEIDGLPEKERNAALAEMEARGEFGFERIHVGKSRDKTSEITLSDTRGGPGSGSRWTRPAIRGSSSWTRLARRSAPCPESIQVAPSSHPSPGRDGPPRDPGRCTCSAGPGSNFHPSIRYNSVLRVGG